MSSMSSIKFIAGLNSRGFKRCSYQLGEECGNPSRISLKCLASRNREVVPNIYNMYYRASEYFDISEAQ